MTTGAADRRTAWDKENTRTVTIKLNKRTDADLLSFLEGSGASKQGLIKTALREFIKNRK